MDWRRGAALIGLITLAFIAARWPTVAGRATLNINDQSTFALFPYHLGTGLIASPQAYLPEPHQGCAILWGVPCAAVFKVLGPTAGALAWCSLVWQASMVAMFALLALRAAGSSAALTVGGLWILAPPGLVASSSFGLPNHIDAGLLTASFALALLAADRNRSRGWSLAAGVLASLAVYFLFDAILVLAGLMAGYMLSTRRTPPHLRWLVAGAVAGAAPYLFGGGYWNQVRGREVLWGILEPADPGATPFIGRVVDLMQRGLPEAFGFWEPLPLLGLPRVSPQVSILLLIAAGVSGLVLAALLDKSRPSGTPSLPLMAGLAAVAHLVGALISGLPLYSFYLTPALSWVLVLCGLGLSAAFARSVPMPFRVLAASSLLLVAAVDSPGRTRASLQSQGSDWTVDAEDVESIQQRRGHRLLRHRLAYDRLSSSTADRLAGLASGRPDHRDELLRVLGRLEGGEIFDDAKTPLRAGGDVGVREAAEASLNAVGNIEGDGAFYFAMGLGESMSRQLDAGQDPGAYLRDVASAVSRLAEASPGLNQGFHLGAMLEPYRRGAELQGRLPALSPETAPQVRAAACTAIGWDQLEVGRGPELLDWLAMDSPCSDREVAVGMGAMLGGEYPAGSRVPAPRLAIWTQPHVPSRELSAGFECGFAAGRQAIESVRSEPQLRPTASLDAGLRRCSASSAGE